MVAIAAPAAVAMMAAATKAVIFLNGNLSDPAAVEKVIDAKTLLIACDGGLRHIVAMGRKPDAVVGDFDSLDATLLAPDISQAHYPKDKDKTDAELAIRHALKLGCTKIIITAYSGDRIDHMLANLYLLGHPDFADASVRIIDAGQEIYIVNDQAVIRGSVGDTISFLPIGGEVRAVSEGLKYELGDYALSPTGNQGVSNTLTRPQAQIAVKQGAILVVHRQKPE